MPSSIKHQVYRDFRRIESGAHHTLVRFYETKYEVIERLDSDSYFEILADYTQALFEIGNYQKHLTEIDKVIELSILHNVQFYQGEDIYCKSLFQKAASAYNLHQFDLALRILSELIKISPYDTMAIRFYKKCLERQQPRYLKYARAVSICLFLGAALVAALEVIIVHPFVPQNAQVFEYSRYLLIGTGLLTLALTYLYHRYQTYATSGKLVRQARLNKQ